MGDPSTITVDAYTQPAKMHIRIDKQFFRKTPLPLFLLLLELSVVKNSFGEARRVTAS